MPQVNIAYAESFHVSFTNIKQSRISYGPLWKMLLYLLAEKHFLF
jgi:hypothetical protein